MTWMIHREFCNITPSLFAISVLIVLHHCRKALIVALHRSEAIPRVHDACAYECPEGNRIREGNNRFWRVKNMRESTLLGHSVSFSMVVYRTWFILNESDSYEFFTPLSLLYLYYVICNHKRNKEYLNILSIQRNWYLNNSSFLYKSGSLCSKKMSCNWFLD